MEPSTATDVAPKAWPPLLALGLVMLLAVSTLVVDVMVDRETHAQTSDLVGDALRSVTLADDLRSQAYVLASRVLDREAFAAVVAHIASDAATYDPLATYPGERAAWSRLQSLLQRLQRLQARGGVPTIDRGLLDEIEGTLDRIVAINAREAARTADAIRDAYQRGFVIDLVGGICTFALSAVVAGALLRAHRRQRALIATRLAAEAERHRELEAFAGRVAHDLRGPLAPIRAYADLLRLGSGPSPMAIGERIAGSTDRMTAMIEDLLTLSTSGRSEPGISAVAPVVGVVVDEMRPELGDAKVELAVDDVRARAPAAAVARIVQNLVSNAAKYRSTERPLVVSISGRQAGHEVELVVGDNGIGMDEPTAAHAFEPLYRAERVRATPGHGLGLSIVKRTVDALGGSCTLTSKLGEGTWVKVKLPAADA